MPEGDEKVGVIGRVIDTIKSYYSILVEAPQTLRKLEKRLSRNEAKLVDLKTELADTTGCVRTILSILPPIKFEKDSTDNQSST